MVDTAELPIRQHTAAIVEAVQRNDAVVVIGETGSGKTTQLSQILLDAGLAEAGVIGVTQPRRVAAVTVARRVAEERRCELGGQVGYAVRFEERCSSSTRIKYLTDGTLLRELLEDETLARYSVIILDEAHERSLNTDILFGVLKTLLGRRQPRLKLVITSATLDGEKFSAYFNSCPVLHVPGRCFPVDVIHSKSDHLDDYVDAAMDATMQIHMHQPPGDILVFLTGQAEIDRVVRSLNDAVRALPADSGAGAMMVLPLYASLPPELQLRVFRPGPQDVRRCIVATNLAETSVTVEGVVYVVDTGVVKQKHYHPNSGMDSLDVVAISRVQATQRAGRAGRTRPGKCFRLYTKGHYDTSMPDTTQPEILRTSLAGAVLHLKALRLQGLDVLTFDFMDRPEQAALEEALRQLYVLDAIDADGAITSMGRRMADLPLDPALARALIEAQALGCLEEMVTVAAMLSAEHVFASGHGPDVGNGLAPGRAHGGDGGARGGRGGGGGGGERMKALVAECQGDHVLLLRLYQMWTGEGCSRQFCTDYGLDVRGMNFARDIRRQLQGITGADGGGLGERHKRRGGPDGSDGRGGDGRGGGGRGGDAAPASLRLPSPAARVELLRRALVVGFANRIARRMRAHNGYRTLGEGGQLAQLHPSSAHLASDDDGLLPEWLVYHEFVATSRPFLRQVCPVHHKWVEPLLPKLRNIDVRRLSGAAPAAPPAPGLSGDGGGTDAGGGGGDGADGAKLARRNDDTSVDAARQRFIARRQQAAAQKRK